MNEEQINHRLERLERSNRQLRLVIIGLAVALVVLAITGATPQEQFIPKVKTNDLAIVDKDGKPRVILLPNEITLLSKDGALRVAIVVTDEDNIAAVSVYGGLGVDSSAGLYASPTGPTSLHMVKTVKGSDAYRTSGIDLRANDKTYGTGARITDDTGKNRMHFGLDNDNWTRLQMFDRDQQVRMASVVSKDGFPMLSMNDEKDNPRIAVGWLPEHPPTMLITDSDGKPKWSAR